MGLAILLKGLMWALLLAGVVITGTAFFQNVDDETRASLINTTIEEPVGSAWKIPAFLYSYQISTPAYTHEWIGDEDHQTWMVEQWPLPDSRDIIPLFFFWLLLLLFAKGYWRVSETNPFLKVLIILLAFIVFTLIAWVIIKTLFFWGMNALAADLGVSQATLTEIRSAEFDHQKEIFGLTNLFLLTALFGVVLLVSLIKGQKDGS